MDRVRTIIFKHKLIVAAAAILLLFVIVMIWWIRWDWNKVGRSNTEDADKASAVVSTLLESENPTLDDLKDGQANLGDIAQRPCGISWRQSWRKLVSDEPKQREEACKALNEKSKVAAETIGALISRLESEQQLADIIKNATNEVSELDPYLYDEAIKNWKKAIKQLEALEVDSSLTEQHDQLRKKSNAILASLESLKTADEENSRSEYDDAYVTLQNNYQELRSIRREVEASFETLLEETLPILLGF